MFRFRTVDRTISQADPLGALEIWGDYGGFSFLMREASGVQASDGALTQLAHDLNAYDNSRGNYEEVGVRWVITNPWTEWGGTPPIEPGLWIRQRLLDRGLSADRVKDVLSGILDRLPSERIRD